MIKSKLQARETALMFASSKTQSTSEMIEQAKKIEMYLIGDADLPETEPSTEDTYTKVFTAALTAAYGCGAIKSDETPCKSEAK